MRTPRPVVALLVALTGVAVLTAFAAVSPVAVRKLLLFAIGFGLCAGTIVAWAACEFGLSRRGAIGLTIPLVVAGLSLIAVQGLYQLRAEQAAATTNDPKQAMARSLLEAAAEGDPELAAALASGRRERIPSFADYLALRVRALGEWRSPWPAVFWGTEMILAALAGTAVVSLRMFRTPKTNEVA